MSISRLLSVVVAVVLVVTAIFSIRAGITTSAVRPSGQDLSDYFQRHPSASVAAARADLSDYFLRHPTSAIPADIGASDWFERHPESLKAGNTVDLSDYYQRHPGVGPN